MAKGNNGNLLQHFVECELASCLVGDDERGLHVVLTHGMAPFEALEPLKRYEPRLFRDRLEWVARHTQAEVENLGYALLRAYKALDASETRYPNSAELLACVVGDRDALAGHVFESESELASRLAAAWEGHHLAVVHDSWRNHANCLGSSNPDSPWLFSMDPYTYRTGRAVADDGYLYDEDLCRLRDCFLSLLHNRQGGAISIFCYALQPCHREKYQAVMERERRILGEKANVEVHLRFADIIARGGNRHVGALLASDDDLVCRVKDKWESFKKGFEE